MGRYVYAHADFGGVGNRAAAAATTIGIGVFAVAVSLAITAAAASAQSYGAHDVEDYENSDEIPTAEEKADWQAEGEAMEPYAEACLSGGSLGNVRWTTPVYKLSPYATAAGCGFGVLQEYGAS